MNDNRSGPAKPAALVVFIQAGLLAFFIWVFWVVHRDLSDIADALQLIAGGAN